MGSEINNKVHLLAAYTKALTLKCEAKIAADDTLFFYLYLSMEIRLDVSCDSSA